MVLLKNTASIYIVKFMFVNLNLMQIKAFIYQNINSMGEKYSIVELHHKYFIIIYRNIFVHECPTLMLDQMRFF